MDKFIHGSVGQTSNNLLAGAAIVKQAWKHPFVGLTLFHVSLFEGLFGESIQKAVLTHLHLTICGLKKEQKFEWLPLKLGAILYLWNRLSSLVPFVGKIEKLISYSVYFTSWWTSHPSICEILLVLQHVPTKGHPRMWLDKSIFMQYIVYYMKNRPHWLWSLSISVVIWSI